MDRPGDVAKIGPTPHTVMLAPHTVMLAKASTQAVYGQQEGFLTEFASGRGRIPMAENCGRCAIRAGTEGYFHGSATEIGKATERHRVRK